MLTITTVLVVLLVAIISTYLWHIRSAYDYFSKLNIPGPPPRLFWGNFLEVIKNKRLTLTINKWTEEYGRIFGYFEGHTPILVISDPDILQDIFTTSFSNFHSRPFFPLVDQSSMGINLFFAVGLRWRRQRFVINPTFSSGKLKQMMPLIHKSVRMLIRKMHEKCEKRQPFDILPYYKRFTMETLWSCGFGIDTDMQHNTKNPYLVCSQQLFAENINHRFLAVFAMLVVELNKILAKAYLFSGFACCWLRQYIPFTKMFISDDPIIWITNEAYRMIEKYQTTDVKSRTDLLKLMLESAIDDDYIEDNEMVEAADNEDYVAPPVIRKLTKHEIAANIVLFIFAGSESSATALGYISYILATHPHEQERLHEHIDAYFNPTTEDEMPSYDTISQMDYLDMVIREALRMYPIGIAGTNRRSIKEYHIEGFGNIPAGTRIALDVYKLHYDSELWGPVDSNVFYPERFATKRHLMSWVPFGAGPRHCVGMRFAFVQIKAVLVRLLKTYNIVDCGEKTRKSFDELKETVIIAPTDVTIRLERRF